jgi:hypothetical protein
MEEQLLNCSRGFFFKGELASGFGIVLEPSVWSWDLPSTSLSWHVGLVALGLDAAAPEAAAFSKLVVLGLGRLAMLTIATRRGQKFGGQEIPTGGDTGSGVGRNNR